MFLWKDNLFVDYLYFYSFISSLFFSFHSFFHLAMNFWAPGAEAPGVDREYEDEGVYIVNDTQKRFSIEQQVWLDTYTLFL